MTMDARSLEDLHQVDCSLHNLTSLTFDHQNHQLFWLQSININSLSTDRRHNIIKSKKISN